MKSSKTKQSAVNKRAVSLQMKIGEKSNSSNGKHNGLESMTQSAFLQVNDFEGQVAIITGAASGIGLAISLKLLKQGVKVALLDINEEGLIKEFKKHKVNASLFPVDVTQEKLVDKTIRAVI